MNSDPTIEPILDSISLSLPLPYRVAIALVLGVWAWGATLQYFYLIKIDILSLIYPQRVATRNSSSSYVSTYRFALVLTGPLIFSLFLFWTFSHRKSSLVIYYDFLPMTYLCFFIAIFVLPARTLYSSGRSRFLATLRRVSIGGLAQTKDGKFGDIILADVLTSYAKIIADLSTTFCMFFSTTPGSADAKPDRTCGSQFLAPIITVIPSLIRIRQCLTEYLRAKSAGEPELGGRHLANALKYTSGLPVIAFSAIHNSITLSLNKENKFLTEQGAYYCWLTAIFINSSYSFYWDVAKDWDLALFDAFYQSLNLKCRSLSSSQFHNPHTVAKHLVGLRQSMSLPNTDLYYFAIILDFILRFLWLIRLSPHLAHFAKSENGIAFLQFSEIGRRWIWIFLRSEAEWIRQFEEKENTTFDDFLVERLDEYEGDD